MLVSVYVYARLPTLYVVCVCCVGYKAGMGANVGYTGAVNDVQ